MAPHVEKATYAEFGRVVGVTKQAAHTFVRDHLDGKQPATTEQFVLEYCAHLRAVASGHLSANGDLDLVQERAQLTRVRRELAELRLSVERGELLEFGEVVNGWQEVIGSARAKLLSLPSRLASSCADLDQGEIEKTARCIVYEALTELGSYRPTTKGE